MTITRKLRVGFVLAGCAAIVAGASGIIPLTGESCGLGYRILFDVTEQGRAVIGRWLGIPDIKLAESWNRGSDDDPHVGSILLSP